MTRRDHYSKRRDGDRETSRQNSPSSYTIRSYYRWRPYGQYCRHEGRQQDRDHRWRAKREYARPKVIHTDYYHSRSDDELSHYVRRMLDRPGKKLGWILPRIFAQRTASDLWQMPTPVSLQIDDSQSTFIEDTQSPDSIDGELRSLHSSDSTVTEEEVAIFKSVRIIPHSAAQETAKSVKKRLFYISYHKQLLPKMMAFRDKIMHDVSPSSRQKNKCWIYGGRKGIHGQTINMTVSFKHNGEQIRLTVHFAFIHLLIEGRLDHMALEGIIERSWHASHLCGNWRCVNYWHIVAEPGPENVNRNSCFGRYKRREFRDVSCLHHPRCLLHLKDYSQGVNERPA